MSRLFLLRHAKAEWADPGQKDFDRVLSPSGVDEAKSVAKQMVELDLVPEHVICSSAIRAVQTIEAMAATIDFKDKMKLEPELYATDAPGYLEIAASSGLTGDIMLVGHNPMMEDLTFALSHTGESDPMHAVNMGFRTAGLAVIDLKQPMAQAATAKGHLQAYLVP